MSETKELVEEQKVEIKEREPLFSKKNKKLITDPLDENNPITIQVLGICSALAVTVQMKAAVVMSVAVLFVLILANVSISMIRNLIPNRIRIIVQLVVVAALVIVSFFKELFGSGKLFGFEIFGNAADGTGLYGLGYMDNGLMLLPPSSLILVAIYIWIQKMRNPSLIETH
jgi:Na+-transporting NADH:ubiquinone oxidoreductase subunit NqrD